MKDYDLSANVMEYARRDFVRIPMTATVDDAINHVRQSQPEGRIIYFYVTDGDDVLRGVLPTRRLLISAGKTPIADLMIRDVIVVPQSVTLLDACEFFVMHRLLALPIVDQQQRIVGVIDVEVYTDEISDLAAKEESNDFFQLIGVRLAEVRQATLPIVFKNRFPWLLCNVAGGLLAAVIAGLFEDILNQVVALALFIPIVLALAESVSIQSLTLTLQAQHGKRRIGLGETLRSLAKELPLGLALGVGCAVLVAGTAWIWKRDFGVAGVVLLSIVISVTSAALVGLLVPAVLRTIQKDPRIASGPITLALTDIVTLIAYLGLATAFLSNR